MELLMVKSGKTSGKVHLLNNTNYPTELGPIMINNIRLCHSDACVTPDHKSCSQFGPETLQHLQGDLLFGHIKHTRNVNTFACPVVPLKL